jgi:hypothetical protein
LLVKKSTNAGSPSNNSQPAAATNLGGDGWSTGALVPHPVKPPTDAAATLRIVRAAIGGRLRIVRAAIGGRLRIVGCLRIAPAGSQRTCQMREIPTY